jgi:hypothetical protein
MSNLGYTLRVCVTASNAAGSSPPACSSPIIVGLPINTAPPVLSGGAQVGQMLSATTGSWTGIQPIGYTYLFEDCDSNGANCVGIGSNGTDPLGNHIDPKASWHTFRSYDVGHTVRVIVTAKNAAGSTTASSAQTPVVH